MEGNILESYTPLAQKSGNTVGLKLLPFGLLPSLLLGWTSSDPSTP